MKQPDTPATFKALNTTQRKMLLRAVSQSVRTDDKNLRQHDIDALEKLAGWQLVRVVQTRKNGQAWKATDKGRGMVAATGLEPCFLHRRSQHGYTESFAEAMRGEPEAFYRDAA